MPLRDEHLEEETPPDSPTISITLRRAIKKLLRRAAIASSYRLDQSIISISFGERRFFRASDNKRVDRGSSVEAMSVADAAA